MNTRKTILFLLTLCCLAALFAMPASAGTDWYECIVDKVGPYGITSGVSGGQIYLTSVDGTWDGSKKFIISASRAKEYLDIGSKALLPIQPKLVEVYADPDASTPLVKGLLLKSNAVQ